MNKLDLDEDDRFDVIVALQNGGWFEGRREDHWPKACRDRLDAVDGFEIFPETEAVLREFGGIKVESSDLEPMVGAIAFEVDPFLAVGEEPRFKEYSRAIGKRTYPLGETYGGNGFLGIDEDGAVYALGDGFFDKIGATMSEAVARMILGRPELADVRRSRR